MSPRFGSIASRWSFLIVGAVGLGMAAAPANADSALTLAPSPILLDDAAPPPLLTQGLDSAGAGKFLTDAGIKLAGYAQASWTYNTNNPDARINGERGLDFENQDLTLNGIALSAERGVDASAGKFDVGARVAVLYGGDGRFTHSNGMFDNRGFVWSATKDGDTGPDEQFDVTEAYVELAIPVGRGITLNIGKMLTPIGYEYVDPTKNTLFSHGYLFNFGAPFSQTGVMAKYSLSDQVNLMAGVTRGWDQSTKDNNGSLDFIGSAEYKPDSQWDLTLVLSTGPQQVNADGYRTELDALAVYTLNEKWSFGGEAMYGVEAALQSNDDYSQWYGAAVYPSYALCNAASLNGRLEWFNDGDGARGVGANNAFEVTLGVSIFPLSTVSKVGNALKIRPELRFDYADSPVFDSGSNYTQTTFAVDAVLAF